jgi:hypothetical protein
MDRHLMIVLGLLLMVTLMKGCAPPPVYETDLYEEVCLNGVSYYSGASGALAPVYTSAGCGMKPCDNETMRGSQ